MNAPNNQQLEAVTENVYLRVIARVSMIVATTIILPVALYIGKRGLDNMDEMQRSISTLTLTSTSQAQTLLAVTESAKQDRSIQSTRDTGQDQDRARIEVRIDKVDTRLRDLERHRAP